jgi:hypothetical protein
MKSAGYQVVAFAIGLTVSFLLGGFLLGYIVGLPVTYGVWKALKAWDESRPKQ